MQCRSGFSTRKNDRKQIKSIQKWFKQEETETVRLIKGMNVEGKQGRQRPKMCKKLM